jgi:cytochrome c peroxidase
LSFGSRQTARHSPSLIGVAYAQWFYWDGRRDSVWSQAVTPIETPGEMDMTRVDAVRYVMTHDVYRPLFARLSSVLGDSDIENQSRFPAGAGPYGAPQGQQEWQKMARQDQVAVSQAFADIGKAIAVYVETLQPEPSRFDRFADELVQGNRRAAYKILDRKERAGLKLFIDQSLPCLRCHNGPQFTNHEFHNVATGSAGDGSYDFGRFVGLQAALVDEFNCRGQFSDATREQCDRVKHATEGHLDQGAFKVPSLRNIAETSPYLHDGRFGSLHEVIEHYRDVPPVTEVVHEVPQFRLTDKEIDRLAAFLESLTAEPSRSESNQVNTRSDVYSERASEP